jgi:hypothetical protein
MYRAPFSESTVISSSYDVVIVDGDELDPRIVDGA